MRLSAETDSPHYFEKVIADRGGDPDSLSVYIDGVSSTMTVEADDIEGWVNTLYYDESGQIAMNDTFDGPAIKRVSGRVEFAWHPAR